MRLGLALALAGGAALALGLAHPYPAPATGSASPARAPKPLSIAGSAAPEPARDATVAMIRGENLAAALVRSGLTRDEAARATAALSDVFDTANDHPGQVIHARISTPGAAQGAGRLIALNARVGDDAEVSLRRGRSGDFQASRVDTPAYSAQRLVTGVVEGSPYLSFVGQGLAPDTAAKITRLFGARLDLSRDIRSGDRFRLLFEVRPGPPGAAGQDGELVYAEIATRDGPRRLYRYSRPGRAGADYGDGQTGAVAVLLLRTPVDGARVTSAFGPRMHPILGFTRMHQGIDFAAPSGTPILAAGNGVIEEARWAGGYGRWLRIRHSDGLETGYGHLLAWAPGISRGGQVHQGQVVGYVGASGLATGPHLHYEVMRAGLRIDPAGLAPLETAAVDPLAAAAFRASRARLDAEVASLTAQCASAADPPASQPPSACIG